MSRVTYWGTLPARERRRVDGVSLVLELPRWERLAHVEPTGAPWWFSVEGTQAGGGRSCIVEAIRADSTAPGDVCAIRAGQGWELAYRAG